MLYTPKASPVLYKYNSEYMQIKETPKPILTKKYAASNIFADRKLRKMS